MMWENEHSKAVSEIFNTLNKNNIKWMVLRNYEGLPDKNRSKDLDLVMDKKDFKKVEQIMYKTLKKLGFSYVLRDIYQYAWCFTFFKITNNKIFSLKIDLLDGFVWKGAQLVHFKELYDNKVSYKNFYIPNKIDDAFMLWIKPLLTGGFVKKKYEKDILNVIKNNPNEFKQKIFNICGKNMGEKVWNFLQKGELEKTISLKNKLGSKIWYTKFKSKPFNTIKFTFEHYYIEIRRRLFRKKGSFCSVGGPDGVGKTTFINLFKHQLAETFVKDKEDICVGHFRPKMLPSLKKLFKGKKYDESKENFTKPHRAKPVNSLSSLIRITYYWFDYILGYFIKIKPICTRGKICIFDRYFYDFIIDPYRARIKLPKRIRYIYWKLVPKPDLIFLLTCDENTIYDRKQELTKEEIKRQLNEYKELARIDTKFIMLNACNSLDNICFEALKNIIETRSEKIHFK